MGPASTIPGPKGDIGAASTVPGPMGPASTIPGPKGDPGNANPILTGLSQVVAQVNNNYCLMPTNQPSWLVVGTDATYTNVFIDGAIMPLQYLTFVGYSGYLRLNIPNPYPGSTLTLKFAASSQDGWGMPSTQDLRVAVALNGSNDVSWTVTLNTSMTYYTLTFDTSFNTHSMSLYIGGNITGNAAEQVESNVYVNDWSIFLGPIATLMEGDLHMVDGIVSSNDVVLNGNSLTTTLSNKANISYVDTKVASLVNSAPATLDTLNELAAALGNDPNFATTMTNTLALKAPKASPTFTGTVSGIDKTMVGLSNAENTTDLNKVISTLTQAALNAKQNTITDGTLTIARTNGLQTALDSLAPSTELKGVSNIINQVNANYCLVPTNLPTWGTNGLVVTIQNQFIIGGSSTLPQQTITIGGTSASKGGLYLAFPNSFPGATLTLQFSASATVATELKLTVIASNGSTTSWSPSITTTMTYFQLTFVAPLLASTMTLYIAGLTNGTNTLQTNGTFQTTDWSIYAGSLSTMSEGDLQLLNGNVKALDVILAGTSLNTQLAGKQATITDASLTIARTNGLQTALDSKQATITDGSLTIARTTGLQTALDAKQATITDGSLTIARTTGLQGALDAKAALAGATFTGNVSAYNLTASGGVYTPILSVNNLTFTVAASGDLDTNGYITAVGKLSAGSAGLTGALTAASATLTGALSAASASLTGALSAASASLTGALSANSVNVSGAFNPGSYGSYARMQLAGISYPNNTTSPLTWATASITTSDITHGSNSIIITITQMGVYRMSVNLTR